MAQKAGSRTLVDPILMRFAGYRSHFGPRFSANLKPVIGNAINGGGSALGYSEIDTPKGWVLASVIGWGRILFDEDFWRAEMAHVVAFADPRDVQPKILQKGTEAWLERVAANYEVPILALGELQEHALMYGEEYVQND
jgi:hypothetical protein